MRGAPWAFLRSGTMSSGCPLPAAAHHSSFYLRTYRRGPKHTVPAPADCTRRTSFRYLRGHRSPGSVYTLRTPLGVFFSAATLSGKVAFKSPSTSFLSAFSSNTASGTGTKPSGGNASRSTSRGGRGYRLDPSSLPLRRTPSGLPRHSTHPADSQVVELTNSTRP